LHDRGPGQLAGRDGNDVVVETFEADGQRGTDAFLVVDD
jgi:hypothetical protein